MQDDVAALLVEQLRAKRAELGLAAFDEYRATCSACGFEVVGSDAIAVADQGVAHARDEHAAAS